VAETESWHRVAAVSDIIDGEAKPARVGELEIALVRVDGAIYAIEDVCPHAYALLSQGFVEGNEIECPLHAARFEISTGKVLCPPADRDLLTYPVRVDGEDVLVNVAAR
jgi:3-phenylpropionate/trans-cinnamate dioxygenase ferredoxin subunit